MGGFFRVFRLEGLERFFFPGFEDWKGWGGRFMCCFLLFLVGGKVKRKVEGRVGRWMKRRTSTSS